MADPYAWLDPADAVFAATAREALKIERAAYAAADAERRQLREHGAGWRCFHCDELFTREADAREHFGFDQSCEPACRIKAGAERGLLGALREAERELAEAWATIQSESTEAARAYHAQAARHARQLIAAEEAGYERGLVDARAESQAAA